MSEIINENLQNRLLEIRNQRVLLDSDVAMLYGVETKRINEAVKNNPEKFPEGHMLSLTGKEFLDLRSKFSIAKFSKIRTTPTIFSEKGLYMLATILKNSQATQATITIIEAFSKIRELARNIKELSLAQDPVDQKTLMQKSGELFTEFFDDRLDTSKTETTLELNFALLKFKHVIKKKKR